MARRGNRRRGRNRGNSYARPISEPCNFTEVALNLTGDEPVALTHAEILAALTAIVPVTSISKYRVSSLIVDPVNSATSIVSVEAHMGISGNTFQSSLATKPLRLRFGKDYADDGMWIVLDGAALTDGALPGNETTTDPFITMDLNGADVSQLELHLRFAWTDPT